MRRRAGAERDELDAPARRIEPAEVAAALRREPDAAVGAGATSWMPVRWRVASGQLRTFVVSLRARRGHATAVAPRARSARVSRRDRFSMAASACSWSSPTTGTLYSTDEARCLQALFEGAAARPDGGAGPGRQARDEDDDVLHVRVSLRHPRPPARRRAALHRRQPEPPDQQGRDLRQGRGRGS